nr:unnamed protein product [Spirometra erinaceieuropaei]
MVANSSTSAQCRHRSHSNHRCCYDFRYRGESTHNLSGSSGSSSTSTPSSRRKRKSSTDSKNNSSGYGCSEPKICKTEKTNKRRRLSSHDVSPRKSRHLETPVKRDRETDLPSPNAATLHECSPRSPVVRFRNGDLGSQAQRGSDDERRRRSRSLGSKHRSSRSKARGLKDGHGSSASRSQRVSSRHGKRRQRRSRERARRKESHEHHKGNKQIAVVPIGDVIKHRFEVRKVLGEGSFGQVLECLDRHTRSLVAVKALKRLDDYREAAKHEVDVLDTISKADRSCRSNCIVTIDFFEWHKHFYIVFPLLSSSVFSFLEQNDYEPYPTEHAASITYQLCEAVTFMHSLGMCHTDLKPENILFVDADYEEVYNDRKGRYVRVVKDPRIKVIDLGSAVVEGERHPTTIQTRHYRAPEVVLEQGWSYPADVWSVGCILYELVTGQCLFMTHDNLEHLAMMERVLGPLPKHMIRNSRRRRYFRHDRLDWDLDSSDGRYVRRHLKPLGETWLCSPDLNTRLSFDLVREMLTYEPECRITCKRAMTHPFLLSLVSN